ncbi:MAG: hypothetical protein HC853_18510 [Anaerolineae bacterium]|nr:hypothetical protein [Anaerolineae bacterium]
MKSQKQFVHLARRGLLLVMALAMLASVTARTARAHGGHPVAPPPNAATNGDAIDYTSDDHGNVEVVLSATVGAPGSNEVMLTMQTTPNTDTPTLDLDWQMPSGAILLGGPATERIALPLTQQRITRAQRVQLAGPGVHKLVASAHMQPKPKHSYAASGVLFVTVDAGGRMTASDRDPNAHSANGTTLENAFEAATVGSTRLPNSPTGDPCFSVSGQITRIDREPIQYAVSPSTTTSPTFAADQIVPVRYAIVQMREEDDLFDDTYGTSTTNNERPLFVLVL